MYYPKDLKNEVTLLTMEQRIEWLEEDRRKLRKKYEKLEKENKFLEKSLDNKELINKSLREELQRYKDMWDSGEF